MSRGTATPAVGAHVATGPTSARRRDGVDADDVMGPGARLAAAGVVVVTLVAVALGAGLHLPVLRGSAAVVFLFALLGVAPLLLVRPMPLARFALLAVAGSITGTIGIGYTMATVGWWHPAVPFAVVVVLTSAVLASTVLRDLQQLRRRERRPAPAPLTKSVRTGSGRIVLGWIVIGGTVLGLATVVVAAVTHVGDPVPAGCSVGSGSGCRSGSPCSSRRRSSRSSGVEPSPCPSWRSAWPCSSRRRSPTGCRP